MPRDIYEKKSFCKRLSIVEGQVKGVKKMIEEDRECKDIIIQISAITSALKNLSSDIFEEHVRGCMLNDLKNERYESIFEAMDLYKRLMK